MFQVAEVDARGPLEESEASTTARSTATTTQTAAPAPFGGPARPLANVARAKLGPAMLGLAAFWATCVELKGPG